ncbi:MAG: peptidoglycan editing factor PgeF [Actinomycetota bacterium]|nr:peptidoglycan editing factor PgeF [Actinomycetota bacterium]
MFVWRTFSGRAQARPGAFLALPALERHGIRAAFTTRTGGVSTGPFASLNLSYFSEDDPGCVRENRALVLGALGMPPDAWTNGRQVHEARVQRAGRNERGRGAFTPDTAIEGTDGLWTDEPGVALSVITADCVPVLLADAQSRRIATLHAGWRGLVAGILQKGVAAIGSSPSDLSAFIGPAIGPCCYEVGDDVAQPARETLGDSVIVVRKGGTYFDLWAGARIALASAGVKEIWPAALCTKCESHRLFSHRAGATARQGLVAVIAP